MTVFLWIPLAIVALWLVVLVAFARPLLARWREPVLRHPVLVIESDDWGAGPLEQAKALRELAAMLGRIRDGTGRPALMTLGMVFEVPDGPRILADGGTTYHGLPLSDPRFDEVCAAIKEGIAAGVFVPQLHGQAHYWPPALLAAAQSDASVRTWLTSPEPAATEDLPSHLQSRWVDAATLPSRPLDAAAIDAAVTFECESYRALFAAAPQVAVATTFVWSDAVERAWARAGIDTVITPGRRATCRDASGAPGGVDARMLNGDRAASGMTYLVRDVYFEPIKGHEPERLAAALAARTRQGRACLIETHRANFFGARAASLAALERGLRRALDEWPTLRFVAPLELARAIRERDPDWIATRSLPRLAARCARIAEIPRFRRAAYWTGLMLPLSRCNRRL
ncbi:MAG: hypothetical protein IT494_00660 [Gammaproteobacteria bacterium]|nr:hypothetical protein [Gammaproteobacteria bacterium]